MCTLSYTCFKILLHYVDVFWRSSVVYIYTVSQKKTAHLMLRRNFDE